MQLPVIGVFEREDGAPPVTLRELTLKKCHRVQRLVDVANQVEQP